MGIGQDAVVVIVVQSVINGSLLDTKNLEGLQHRVPKSMNKDWDMILDRLRGCSSHGTNIDDNLGRTGDQT